MIVAFELIWVSDAAFIFNGCLSHFSIHHLISFKYYVAPIIEGNGIGLRL